MRTIVLENELFYCHHIGDADIADVMKFSSLNKKGKGLEDYLKRHAFPDEDNGMMRTYLVRSRFTDELVAYFSLKTGHVSINEYYYIDEGQSKIAFDNLPGIEIANIAVNGRYVQFHPASKGVGVIVFREFIQKIISQVAEAIGVKLIFIFALPEADLIKVYSEKYGFVRLPKNQEEQLHARIKPTYDESCIFMYQLLKK